MSRRSLRLDDGLLDRSLPHSSTSFSAGGSTWRNTRLLKSRHSQQLSSSCSESLLSHNRHKATGPSLLNSSLQSVASDASLLSSLMDESSIQETTLIDTFWGLDQDVEPKESTVLANSTLIGSDSRCPKHPVQALSRVYCKDCESDKKEPVTTYGSSSSVDPGHSEPRGPETPKVYFRDRSRKSRTDVLQLWLDSSLLCVRRAAACCGSVLTHTWQVWRGLASNVTEVNIQTENRHTARFSHCGVMNLKELTLNQKLRPNGSLCKTAGEVFRWLSRQWYHMTTSFLLTRFPLRLLLVLLPLLLLFSLCWFGPSVLQSVLPAICITEWRTALSDVPGLSSIYSLMSSQRRSAGGALEETRELQIYVELLHQPPPAATPTREEEELVVADDESVRLILLERSLTALWERVEAKGQLAEQRHREVLQLYVDLQQQLISARSGGVELSSLLDQQLSQLRGDLDEERLQRQEIRQQHLVQQQSQMSRLDQLEMQLQTFAAKMEAHWRQEAATTVSPSPTTLPVAVSVGVDRQSHDALLAEVARLEAALKDVRRDVEGLSGCQDSCKRLDRIQQMISSQVSAQVRKDVHALMYGNQLTVEDDASGEVGALPELLLQWLSQQYTSKADLQAALTSLELSILQNISLQLQQHRGEETVREAVLHAAVTQEEVHVIVKNALRLFSQDRTGLADYALESGGGSILSTRCSETYETKAALLSLFGVPLWYFSQSPRAVIQPDVHPGNCWAFRGSTGFLVIRLSLRIVPTAFSLEHIPKSLAPSRTLHSAPRDFNVYGLDDESQERGKLLGTYTYDEDGEALQTYSVTEENDGAFQIIEVQVLSNWGHQDYTCMYRFRVHGTPHS